MTLAVSAWAGDWGKAAEGAWGKADAAAAVAGKRLSVEEPIVVGDVALYPVIDREADGAPDLDVATLGGAMSDGVVTVREAQNGVVSSLVFANHGEEPVLVMAGDVVHGGMQDRVVQQSQLVAGGRAVVVPVRCVERGRWTGGEEGFVYAGRVDPTLRAVVRAGTQEDTWSAVAARNAARGVDGAASWLHGRDLDATQLAVAERELAARLADDKRVVGLVVAKGGAFTGAEVYPHPALFAQDRLEVLSGQLAAVPARAGGAVPSRLDAVAFLEDELAAE